MIGWDKCSLVNFLQKQCLLNFKWSCIRNMFNNFWSKSGSFVFHRNHLWIHMLIFNFIKIELHCINIPNYLLFLAIGQEQCCPICCSEYIKDDIATELPCHHFFHKPCVSIWLQKVSFRFTSFNILIVFSYKLLMIVVPFNPIYFAMYS